MWLQKWKVSRTKCHGWLRGGLVLLVFLLQVILLSLLLRFLMEASLFIYLILQLSSVLIALFKINDFSYHHQFWIVLLLLFPGFGLLLYFLWGSQFSGAKWKEKMSAVENHRKVIPCQPDSAVEGYARQYPEKALLIRYLLRQGFPIYTNTKLKYYPVGDVLEPDFLKDLDDARHSIFMEYFILCQGQWWEQIEQILIRKASEGVEIRLLVDDFGCLLMDVAQLRQKLKGHGIQVAVFGPIHHHICSLGFNYRNHQKITVIDGRVAYTGGINLADEYVNRIRIHGHWKDTAIRLEGSAVGSLLTTFLTLWEFTTGQKENIQDDAVSMTEKMLGNIAPARKKIQDDTHPVQKEKVWHDNITHDKIQYMKLQHERVQDAKEAQNYVQPYWGGPHQGSKNPVIGAYLRMMTTADKYLYITTPYLILDAPMTNALLQAAENGVDVRIVVPHIYDKWYVYMVNVSNYGKLIKDGIRIYEYLPGFIHAKNFLVDDVLGICGTVNLDFRSLHLHYENAVLLSDTQVLGEMKRDFQNLFQSSKEVQWEVWKNRPWWQKLVQWILKLFSPLL